MGIKNQIQRIYNSLVKQPNKIIRNNNRKMNRVEVTNLINEILDKKDIKINKYSKDILDNAIEIKYE